VESSCVGLCLMVVCGGTLWVTSHKVRHSKNNFESRQKCALHALCLNWSLSLFQSLGLVPQPITKGNPHTGFRVQGVGFGIKGLGVKGLRVQSLGLRFRVQGLGFGVKGLGRF